MSDDWKKGSGFVKEPKIHESQEVTVKGTKTRKPVKATWY